MIWMMRTIDVHDLPEPVAQAIAAMVNSLRSCAKTGEAGAPSLTVGQVIASILAEAANVRRQPGAALVGHEAEVADAVVDKFRRQGLNL
jgi:hypothetical protein